MNGASLSYAFQERAGHGELRAPDGLLDQRVWRMEDDFAALFRNFPGACPSSEHATCREPAHIRKRAKELVADVDFNARAMHPTDLIRKTLQRTSNANLRAPGGQVAMSLENISQIFRRKFQAVFQYFWVDCPEPPDPRTIPNEEFAWRRGLGIGQVGGMGHQQRTESDNVARSQPQQRNGLTRPCYPVKSRIPGLYQEEVISPFPFGYEHYIRTQATYLRCRHEGLNSIVAQSSQKSRLWNR